MRSFGKVVLIVFIAHEEMQSDQLRQFKGRKKQFQRERKFNCASTDGRVTSIKQVAKVPFQQSVCKGYDG